MEIQVMQTSKEYKEELNWIGRKKSFKILSTIEDPEMCYVTRRAPSAMLRFVKCIEKKKKK